MTKNITLTVPDDIWRAMKEHPEVNWSTVARKALDSFVKVLSKAEGVEERFTKQYGNEVTSRVNFSIGENYSEGKYAGEAGMMGQNFNAGINFNISVNPTKSASNKKTDIKETLKDSLKE